MVKEKNQTNKSSNKNIINIKIDKKKKKRNNKKKSNQPQSGTYINNVVQSSAPAPQYVPQYLHPQPPAPQFAPIHINRPQSYDTTTQPMRRICTKKIRIF